MGWGARAGRSSSAPASRARHQSATLCARCARKSPVSCWRHAAARARAAGEARVAEAPRQGRRCGEGLRARGSAAWRRGAGQAQALRQAGTDGGCHSPCQAASPGPWRGPRFLRAALRISRAAPGPELPNCWNPPPPPQAGAPRTRLPSSLWGEEGRRNLILPCPARPVAGRRKGRWAG